MGSELVTRQYQSKNIADIGDYLKVFACSAVMVQPIIALIITKQSPHVQTNLGSIYNLVKYTAPAFIFGILYTTIRQHDEMGYFSFREYYHNVWHALFLPTILWSIVYLIFMPSVQQAAPYHNLCHFCWQLILGNAAPHLWYSCMMLQFILLMPFFWALSKWVGTKLWKGWSTFFVTALVYFVWINFYQIYVFHGPMEQKWYLLDRLFISFIIYAVYGVLAWNFRRRVDRWLNLYWPLTLVGLAAMFVKTNHELRSFGFPININNATYYKPSMTFYSFMVIGLIAAFAVHNINHNNETVQRFFHLFADLAYGAFLGNVFWEQLIWRCVSLQLLSKNHPYIVLILTWFETWCLSFAFAYLLKRTVKELKGVH